MISESFESGRHRPDKQDSTKRILKVKKKKKEKVKESQSRKTDKSTFLESKE